MSLKAQLEAIIYAAETPITLEQMVHLVKDTIVAEGVTDDGEIKSRVRSSLEELVGEYSSPSHGVEIRQVAGGYRMSTKPEQHEVVRSFAKSLKPPIRLSLPALETLAVIAYKQPVTVPEINDIRGVDSGGVIGTLLDRKVITTAGRKQVIGRPILYKTTKEFLMRFGLKDVNELPSMEEFEKLVAESFQGELIPAESAGSEAVPDAPAPNRNYPKQACQKMSTKRKRPVEEAPQPVGPREFPSCPLSACRKSSPPPESLPAAPPRNSSLPARCRSTERWSSNSAAKPTPRPTTFA
jgi:segregation and condensation protein B